MRLSRSGIGLSLVVHALAVCGLMRAVWQTPAARGVTGAARRDRLASSRALADGTRRATGAAQPPQIGRRLSESDAPDRARRSRPANRAPPEAVIVRRPRRRPTSRPPRHRAVLSLPNSSKRAGALPLTYSRTARAPTCAARLRSPGRSRQQRAFDESERIRRRERGLGPPLTVFDSPAKGRAALAEEPAVVTASTGSRTTATCSASRPSACGLGFAHPARPADHLYEASGAHGPVHHGQAVVPDGPRGARGSRRRDAAPRTPASTHDRRRHAAGKGLAQRRPELVRGAQAARAAAQAANARADQASAADRWSQRARLGRARPANLLLQRRERRAREHHAAADHREQRLHLLELFVGDREERLVEHDEIRELARLDRAEILSSKLNHALAAV